MHSDRYNVKSNDVNDKCYLTESDKVHIVIYYNWYHDGQVGTKEHILLFDILTLGAAAFDRGLGDVLENDSILKVSNCLFIDY